jgi:hypothetical protein
MHGGTGSGVRFTRFLAIGPNGRKEVVHPDGKTRYATLRNVTAGTMYVGRRLHKIEMFGTQRKNCLPISVLVESH